MAENLTHRRAETEVVRTGHIDQDMFLAFNRVYKLFIEHYGRVPNWDHVTFQGSTTNGVVSFEIAEEIQ